MGEIMAIVLTIISVILFITIIIILNNKNSILHRRCRTIEALADELRKQYYDSELRYCATVTQRDAAMSELYEVTGEHYRFIEHLGLTFAYMSNDAPQMGELDFKIEEKARLKQMIRELKRRRE